MVREQIEESDPLASRPPEIVSELAQRVVALLTELADGAPLDNYFVLRSLAERLWCSVTPDLGHGSSYARVSVGVWQGVIRLDVSQEPDDVLRDLAHELTHHILAIYRIEDEAEFTWGLLPAVLFDRATLEESVCHAVAGIIKAVPAGMQWNGKLAIPRGDGKINVYTPLKVRVPSQSIPASEWERLDAG